MKNALCTRGVFERINGGGALIISVGEIVEYTKKGDMFVIRGVLIPSNRFFGSFSPINNEDRMSRSDFIWVLINRIFTDAYISTSDYHGYHMIINTQFHGIVMLTINEAEDEIRISFPDRQEKFGTFEDALEGIRNHKIPIDSEL